MIIEALDPVSTVNSKQGIEINRVFISSIPAHVSCQKIEKMVMNHTEE